jgi:hypothetical protein
MPHKRYLSKPKGIFRCLSNTWRNFPFLSRLISFPFTRSVITEEDLDPDALHEFDLFLRENFSFEMALVTKLVQHLSESDHEDNMNKAYDILVFNFLLFNF